jgi:hypothetical protein
MNVRFLILLSVVGIIAGCAEIRDSGSLTQFSVIDSPKGVTVFYDRDVQRIFNQSCTGGCHEPNGTGVLQASLDLTESKSFAELLDATQSRNGPQVVENEPDNSILIWKVEGVDAAGRTVFGDRMPHARPTLGAEDIGKLRTWIAEGALWSIAPPSPPAIDRVGVRDSVTFEITFDKALEVVSTSDVSHYRLVGEDGSELTVFEAFSKPINVSS